MILIDANLLIYAIDADSHHHGVAKAWLEETLSGTDRVGLAWIVLLAFLRITTREGILARTLTLAAAIGYVDSWLAQPNVELVTPGPHFWPLFRGLILASGTAGNLTSDAHLAAMAIERGATVCSTDNDYGRFPGLLYTNPLTGP
ncbi:MAG: type II toxin-antitoxin system VapC family toxin [Acidobacteria bacterium]|nr:type II toxin-antitoxin system VapC family toxin [Acidobacteriota bacterium]